MDGGWWKEGREGGLTRMRERKPTGLVRRREVLEAQRERSAKRSVCWRAIRMATADREARWVRRMTVRAWRLRPIRRRKAGGACQKTAQLCTRHGRVTGRETD